jgi:exosortase
MSLEVRNQTVETVAPPSPTPGLAEELRAFGETLPDKGWFAALLAAWCALFHFLGNSTFGYVASPSLFAWLWNAHANAADDSLGGLIPLAVFALLWWKREELAAVPKRAWWPAVVVVALALLMHVAGYVVQQPRVSVVAFFVGLYALTGLVWGWAWLKATFFPYFLFAFVMPMSSDMEGLTLPLRQMATKITVIFSHVLGIDVVQQGTQIFDRAMRFQYNVEAACSGLRSLTTMLALSCVFAFVFFRRTWKRAAMIATSVPLAVLGNATRLMAIVIAAENFGQSAGNFVHDHWFFSLLPYVPSVIGMALLAKVLREPEDAPAGGARE